MDLPIETMVRGVLAITLKKVILGLQVHMLTSMEILAATIMKNNLETSKNVSRSNSKGKAKNVSKGKTSQKGKSQGKGKRSSSTSKSKEKKTTLASKKRGTK